MDEVIILDNDEIIRADTIQQLYNNWMPNYVYTPYVPLIVTELILPDDFRPRKVQSEHKVTKFLKKIIRI